MKFRNPFKRVETRAGNGDISWDAMRDMVTGGPTNVTGRGAEGIAAVYACVQALSESTAALPLHVYAVDDNGDRVRADEHPLAQVLKEPNEHMSGLAFREMMTASVLLEGNAYAKKEWNRAGELVALYPIPASNVSLVRLPSGRFAFDVTWPVTGKHERIMEDEMFHLRDRLDVGGYGAGILGKSRITVARETLGSMMAQRNLSANMYRNAMSVGGFMKPEHNLNETQLNEFNRRMANYTAPENAGRVMMLLKGMEYVAPPKMSMVDAQWIESMQYGTEEVARIFRVPPPMIADLKHGTFTNTVELSTWFARYSLSRWVAMWEQELERSCLGPIARRRYDVRHNVDGLLRGSPEARATYYKTMIEAGVMTVDECRTLETLPALQKIAGPN